MHRSNRELVSQIAGVESTRMALDAAHVKVIEKLRRDCSYMYNIWKDNGRRRSMQEGRTWDDFYMAYLVNNGYMSIIKA